jgi:hypothetical protein
MAFIISTFYKQFLTVAGTPLDNGIIRIGTAGEDPSSSPVQVYWDYGLTEPATQPIRTKNGYPINGTEPANLYVSPDTVSIEVLDENGSRVFYNLSWFLIDSSGGGGGGGGIDAHLIRGTNVLITSLSNEQVLMFNGTNYVNTDISYITNGGTF